MIFSNGLTLTEHAKAFAEEKTKTLKFLLDGHVFKIDHEVLKEILEITYAMGALDGMKHSSDKWATEMDEMKKKITGVMQ